MPNQLGKIFGGKRASRKQEEAAERRKQEEEKREKQEKDARNAVATQIERDLYMSMRNRDNENLRFICGEDLSRIWTLSRLEQLSKGLAWASPDMLKLAQKSFLKVLSTLVWIHWESWKHFDFMFLQHSDIKGAPDRTDEHLPFNDISFLQDEKLESFFRDQQYLFKPVIIVEDHEEEIEDINYLEKERMPFFDTKVIGSGGSGEVTKETIPPGYFRRKNSEYNTMPLLVARKRVKRARIARSSGPWNFSIEQQILKEVKSCLEANPYIMRSYTNFLHGEHFTIISPVADIDLSTFLEGDYDDFKTRCLEFSPAHLIHGTYCLARALKFLHEGLQPIGISGKLYCAHLDFKPENILVMWKGKEEPVGRWLVHDFGNSKIKGQSSTQAELAPPELLRQFSLTQSQRPPGPFLAPEVKRSDERVVGRESDIWSLGCVLAVVLAFACGGPPFVHQLADSRFGHPGCDDDYFYVREGSTTVVKPKVVTWLGSLDTGRKEDAWIKKTLRLIFKMLVDTPGARPRGREVRDELHAIYTSEGESLREVCQWVSPQLPTFPTESPIIPAEVCADRLRTPIEFSRTPDSLRTPEWFRERIEWYTPSRERLMTPSDVPRIVNEGVWNGPAAYSGIEAVSTPATRSQRSSTTQHTVFDAPELVRPTSHPDPSDPSLSESSSHSSKPVNVNEDTQFMRLETPIATFKTAICPSACHVAFLSKGYAAIMLLGDEGSWTTRSKPLLTSSGSRIIACPDGWEWDLIVLSRQYLVLRSRKPRERDRKIYQYKCDEESGRLWNEVPLNDPRGDLQTKATDALDIAVSRNGDILFICDTRLWYYSAKYRYSLELFTKGQNRQASAGFSPDGRWVYGSSHERVTKSFYKWDTLEHVSVSDTNRTKTLKRMWEISVPLIASPRLGTGRFAIFPFSHYFVAFELPDRIYTVGKDTRRPCVVQGSTPVRNVVAGASFQATRGEERIESLILLQESSLITLPMHHHVTGSPSPGSKLKHTFTKVDDGFAVLDRDSKSYVVVSHTNGILERRGISSR